MLEPNFFGTNCYVNLKLMDVFLQNGEIMSKLLLDNASTIQLKYNTLKTIVPAQWRKSLKKTQT